MDAVRAHERDIAGYALERLAEVPGVTIMGPRDADARGALVSFTLDSRTRTTSPRSSAAAASACAPATTARSRS